MKILCSVSTYNRYDTTLPLALMSIANQTRKPDKLIIFDDNKDPKDLRTIETYQYIFQIFDINKIDWEVIYGQKKGQHHNHQIANTMGYDWVWRMDDDTVAEPDVLEKLCSYIDNDIGSIGGSVLTPPISPIIYNSTGKIENIFTEPNIQWNYIKEKQEVEHLHCSFLYRAGIVDYNLSLSRVAHREETLFTYELFKNGYKNLVIPDCITWHLKNQNGGIRSIDINKISLFEHDENIFKNHLNFKDKTVVVLDCGMGDHIVFKHMMDEIEDPVIFSCYPEIVPGRSIAEAKLLLGNIDSYNIYRKMDIWNWKDSLENAFRRMYVK